MLVEAFQLQLFIFLLPLCRPTVIVSESDHRVLMAAIWWAVKVLQVNCKKSFKINNNK